MFKLSKQEIDKLIEVYNFIKTNKKHFVVLTDIKNKLFNSDNDITFTKIILELIMNTNKYIEEDLSIEMIYFNKELNELIKDTKQIKSLSYKEKKNIETILYLKNKDEDIYTTIRKSLIQNEIESDTNKIPYIPELEHTINLLFVNNNIPEEYKINFDSNLINSIHNQHMCYVCGNISSTPHIHISGIGPYDSPLDGTEFEITICTDCLIQMFKNNIWVGKNEDNVLLLDNNNDSLSKTIFILVKNKLLSKPFGTNFNTDIEKYIKFICYYDKYFSIEGLYWLVYNILLPEVFNIDLYDGSLNETDSSEIKKTILSLLEKYNSNNFKKRMKLSEEMDNLSKELYKGINE